MQRLSPQPSTLNPQSSTLDSPLFLEHHFVWLRRLCCLGVLLPQVQVEGGPMGYIEGTFGSSGQSVPSVTFSAAMGVNAQWGSSAPELWGSHIVLICSRRRNLNPTVRWKAESESTKAANLTWHVQSAV